MKRKFTEPTSKNSGMARILSEKVEEYIKSLESNEDEIVKIVAELSSRDVSQSQLSGVSDTFSSYSKTAKNLTKYIKEL